MCHTALHFADIPIDLLDLTLPSQAMYDQEESEPAAPQDDLAAAPTFGFPSQLFTEEDAEDNNSYVRGYN